MPHALSAPLICRWFNSHWVEKMIVARPPARRLRQAEAQRLERRHRASGVRGRRGRRGGVDASESHRADPSRHRRALAAGDAADHLGRAGTAARRRQCESLAAAHSTRMPRAWALRQIHFPETCGERSRKRGGISCSTEFFAMQLCCRREARRASRAARRRALRTGDADAPPARVAALPAHRRAAASHR